MLIIVISQVLLVPMLWIQFDETPAVIPHLHVSMHAAQDLHIYPE